MGLGPRQLHHPHPMLAALTAWRCGVQNGAVLTGIQMPPLPFRLMIIERTTGSTIGAGPFGFVVMGQVDMHLPLSSCRSTRSTRQGSLIPKIRPYNSESCISEFCHGGGWGGIWWETSLSLFPSLVERGSQRRGAVKGAPVVGAAKRNP